jgi:hypothetical protein
MEITKKLRHVSQAALLASLALSAACTTTRPFAVSSNPIGTKVGRASSQAYLGGLFIGGDGSIQAAAKQGRINRVATVDVETFNFLYLFIKRTTVVTGE